MKREFHGQSKRPIYKIWTAMKQRCSNENTSHYYLYGGSGITVSEEWKSFSTFFADMGHKPAGHSLDRIDGSKGYSKENCRWATHAEQLANRKIYSSSKANTSGVIGVYWKGGKHNKFVARVTESGVRKYLGFYKTLSEASDAMESWRAAR